MSVIEAMALAICETDGADTQWADDYIDFVRAALAAARKHGWQLVPVEPTIVMQGKGSGTLGERGVPISYNAATHCYRAMLSAAPSVEDA